MCQHYSLKAEVKAPNYSSTSLTSRFHFLMISPSLNFNHNFWVCICMFIFLDGRSCGGADWKGRCTCWSGCKAEGGTSQHPHKVWNIEMESDYNKSNIFAWLQVLSMFWEHPAVWSFPCAAGRWSWGRQVGWSRSTWNWTQRSLESKEEEKVKQSRKKQSAGKHRIHHAQICIKAFVLRRSAFQTSSSSEYDHLVVGALKKSWEQS